MSNWAAVSQTATVTDVLVNAILLLALVVLLILLFTKRVRSHALWVPLMWFAVSLSSAYALIFTAAHFETRYFYFPKIVGVLMVLIVICLHFRSAKCVEAIDLRQN